MDVFSGPVYLTVVAIFTALLFASRAPSSIKARRRGIDPGLFYFKLWPARILFLVRGPKIVDDAYREVVFSCAVDFCRVPSADMCKQQTKDEKYLLQTMLPDRVILPPKFLPELRMLPANKLSASAALVETTLGHYNGVDIILKDRQSNDVCRVQLTKSLPQILPVLAEELHKTLSEHLRACTPDEYNPYNARDLIFALNLRTTSLSFAGRKLCRSNEWDKVITEYQDAVAGIAIGLIPFPEVLRPFVKPFIPATKRMTKVHERVRMFLFSPDFHENDGLPTVLKHYISTSKEVDEREIVSKFLVLSSAALHTMTNATLQVLFDLCAHPRYIDELRQEALGVLEENGGEWGLKATKSMKRMDSFFKESQRLNPPNFLAFDRVVQSPIKLSDGTTLPAGQFISIPAWPMSRDPEYYDNPLSFDGYRFLRDEGFESEQGRSDNEFAGIEPWNIHWGNGRFTCPGRWYASALMKLFVASILMQYDIKFPDGQTERPQNSYLDDGIVPSGKQEILFRLRR